MLHLTSDNSGGIMPAWAWVLVAIVGLLLVELLYQRIVLKLEHEIDARLVDSDSDTAIRTWVVFKGFSNPFDEFAEGMERVLDGPMIVANYGTCAELERLFQKILDCLKVTTGPERIAIYGHSRGGQVGELFRQWYEKQGSPYGPICELYLDCTPGDRFSLPAPGWATKLAQRIFRLYKGGPVLALFVAIGNWYSRKVMPAPLDETVDRDLIKRYQRKLMWYNSVRWVFELYAMLTFDMPPPQKTSTKVYYIGAADPSRDKIVNQATAIKQWKVTHPGLDAQQHSHVGHAWPLEQPKAYRAIVSTCLLRNK